VHNMVSILGFGIDAEGLTGRILTWILTILLNFFNFASDTLKYLTELYTNFIIFIVGNFHYDNEKHILALSGITLLGLIIILGVIGGAGMHGQTGLAGTSALGINIQGFNIGSNVTVASISEEGTKDIGLEGGVTTITATTTIGENETIGDNLSCNTWVDCVGKNEEWTVNYCCPAFTGDCGGYCVIGACNGGYDDDGSFRGGGWDVDCEDMCNIGECMTSFSQIFLTAPLNNTVQNDSIIKFDWRGV